MIDYEEITESGETVTFKSSIDGVEHKWVFTVLNDEEIALLRFVQGGESYKRARDEIPPGVVDAVRNFTSKKVTEL